MRALEQSKTRDEIVVLHLHMELLESEFDKMMEVNPEQSLHTQISETGYQPYMPSQFSLGSVAETRGDETSERQRSRSPDSRKSSRGSSGSRSVVQEDLKGQLQLMEAALRNMASPFLE